ncbi:MAG: glycosyltransferase [Chloroflexi bacterium]|nr:glycosyltransferase [Chloroflexota bacterium]
MPGYKGGGPIRTIANLVAHLGDEFDFRILTADHDLGDAMPYEGVMLGQWQQVGKAQVRYLTRRERSWPNWRRLLQEIDYDILYLNSFFSTLTIKTLFWRRLGLFPARPIILAPRGEFSPGALELKQTKKQLYIDFALRMRLSDKLIWQATGVNEKQDILNIWQSVKASNEPLVTVVPNLPPADTGSTQFSSLTEKTIGNARIVFLSRIARNKNLDYAVNLLRQTTDDIVFDIYGPIEDETYWQECLALMQSLPNNVQVSYKGAITADDVPNVLSCYHLLLFPTRGENFGHVILEALSSGCPVLISDQTPWRNLTEQKAGWDLPLEKPEAFQSALAQIVDMDATTFSTWSAGARKMAQSFSQDTAIIDANRNLFLQAREHG